MLKKWFEVPNLSNGFLTIYHGSLKKISWANDDFREQIFARYCYDSGSVFGLSVFFCQTRNSFCKFRVFLSMADEVNIT